MWRLPLTITLHEKERWLIPLYVYVMPTPPVGVQASSRPSATRCPIRPSVSSSLVPCLGRECNHSNAFYPSLYHCLQVGSRTALWHAHRTVVFVVPWATASLPLVTTSVSSPDGQHLGRRSTHRFANDGTLNAHAGGWAVRCVYRHPLILRDAIGGGDVKIPHLGGGGRGVCTAMGVQIGRDVRKAMPDPLGNVSVESEDFQRELVVDLSGN